MISVMLKISSATKIKLINFYPPFLGAGIKLKYLSKDFMRAEVEMKLRWWNKNMMGTHFGGSLAAMADPFYALLIMQNVGKGFIVWDKAQTIRFKRPGTGKVTAVFEITSEFVAKIKKDMEGHEKMDYELPLQIKNEAGEIVCELMKTIHVKHKVKPQHLK